MGLGRAQGGGTRRSRVEGGCVDHLREAAVQQRLAQGVACMSRILFLQSHRGFSESVACERVATSYQRACGPCRPEAAIQGPSPKNEAWAGPQGRSKGACRTANGGGTFVVAPMQTNAACRAACDLNPTCVAYEFVRTLVHGVAKAQCSSVAMSCEIVDRIVPALNHFNRVGCA